MTLEPSWYALKLLRDTIHYPYSIHTSSVSCSLVLFRIAGCWSLSQRSFNKSKNTPWTCCQSFADYPYCSCSIKFENVSSGWTLCSRCLMSERFMLHEIWITCHPSHTLETAEMHLPFDLLVIFGFCGSFSWCLIMCQQSFFPPRTVWLRREKKHHRRIINWTELQTVSLCAVWFSICTCVRFLITVAMWAN